MFIEVSWKYLLSGFTDVGLWRIGEKSDAKDEH